MPSIYILPQVNKLPLLNPAYYSDGSDRDKIFAWHSRAWRSLPLYGREETRSCYPARVLHSRSLACAYDSTLTVSLSRKRAGEGQAKRGNALCRGAATKSL
jgi:hypothetical protein